MPKIDLLSVPAETGSGYPGKLAEEVAGRTYHRLGNAAGLTQFGANLVTLEPGAKSSIRHWHEKEDEFAYVTAGELVLIEDEGETILRPGDAAGFKAGVANGHTFVNRTDKPAQFLVIGTRLDTETGHYPEHDLLAQKRDGKFSFTTRDGQPID